MAAPTPTAYSSYSYNMGTAITIIIMAPTTAISWLVQQSWYSNNCSNSYHYHTMASTAILLTITISMATIASISTIMSPTAITMAPTSTAARRAPTEQLLSLLLL